jgi:hypothetical protein
MVREHSLRSFLTTNGLIKAYYNYGQELSKQDFLRFEILIYPRMQSTLRSFSEVGCIEGTINRPIKTYDERCQEQIN